MDINEPMINEEIRDREVRVVATDGTQLGVMSTQAAKAVEAEKRELKPQPKKKVKRESENMI